MSEFDFSDAVNPFASNKATQDFDFTDAVNPFDSGPDRSLWDATKDTAQDLAVSLAKAPITAVEGVAGLVDIPSGGRFSKALENEGGAVGFRPRQAKEVLDQLHTDSFRKKQQEFHDADGILDKTVVALQNPSLVTNTVAESSASMLMGGGAGRLLKTAFPKVSGATAGAAGEGAMMAGAQAAEIRSETEDGLLTAGQSAAAAGTGVLGGLFGYFGGQLANKLGIGDVDTLLAQGLRAGDLAEEIARTPAKSVPRKVIEGAITEGFLEELPQSVSETIIKNLALDKQWNEGLDDAIVMGTLAGMAVGGPIGAVRQTGAPQSDELNDAPADAAPQAVGSSVAAPAFPEQGDPVIWSTPDGETNAVFAGIEELGGQQLARVSIDGVDSYVPMDQLKWGMSEGQGNPSGPIMPGSSLLDTSMDDSLKLMEQDLLTGDADLDAELAALLGEIDQARSEGAALEAELAAGTDNSAGQLDGIDYSPVNKGELGAGLSLQPLEDDSAGGGYEGGINFDNGQPSVIDTKAQVVIDRANDHIREQEDLAAAQAYANETAEPVRMDAPDIADLSDHYAPDATANVRPSPAAPRLNVQAADSRLARPEYRSQLDRMAAELIKGGGVSYVRDSNDRIVKRTPSLNADWFKSLNENPETSMSVEDTQAAIKRALSGEKLGVRQLRVVGVALDTIGEERGSYARELRAMRENARQDRRQAYEQWLEATSVPVNAEFESLAWPENPGEQFLETDYLVEQSIEDRATSELVSVADSLGVEWGAIDNALSAGDINAQTKALTQLIWDSRNEHRQSTKSADQPAVSPASAQGRPTTSQRADRALEKEPANAAQSTAEIVDATAAAEAATAPENNLPEPTAAQKEAGNYKKAHVKIQGLDISIENARGSTRSGIDNDGNAWSVTMHNHYGYLKRTEGADGDHVDVFIGPNPDSNKVFIVDQVNEDGTFDEHKVLLGFDSKLKARSGYKSNYSNGWKVGPITSINMDEFKSWLKNGDTTKPLKRDHFPGTGKMVPTSMSVPRSDQSSISNNAIKEVRSPETGKFDNQTQEPQPSAGVSRSEVAAVKDPLTVGTHDPVQPIEDFGQKLGGARKDAWGGFRDAITGDVNTATLPLSQSFPEPDYVKLAAEGVPMDTLALIAAIRHEIPTKPRVAYKIKSWASQVDSLREFAADLIGGNMTAGQVTAQMEKAGLSLRPLADALPAIAKANAETLKLAAKYRIRSDAYTLFNGQKYSPAKVFYTPTHGKTSIHDLASDNKQEVQEALAQLIAREANANRDSVGKKQSNISIYQDRQTRQVFLGWKGGSGVLRIQSFGSTTEARKYLAENRDDVEAKLQRIKATPSERRAENRTRSGVERFSGNVTPAVFADTFGLRGVEFGNWVEQGRRQKDLNEAYDALMDLADVLGIPPKALALNGELGLAFGARGKGGKNSFSAHYEPGSIVMNLTKNKGAGSLAHEWFHAVDNYFGRVANMPDAYATEGSRIRGGDMRPEVRAAFDGVMKAIGQSGLIKRAKMLDKRRSKPYWSTEVELAARAFESFIIAELESKGFSNDYLANIVEQEAWEAAEAMGLDDTGSYPYPTKDEQGAINQAFRILFDTLQTKETDSGIALFSLEDSAITSRSAADNDGKAKVGEVSGGASVSEVEADAVVQRIIAGIQHTGGAGLKRLNGIEVVSDVSELPAAIQNAAKKQSNDGNRIEGVFHNNSIYINRSALKTPADVERVVLHELYGHFGIRQLFDTATNQAMGGLYLSVGGAKGVKEMAARHGIDLARYESGYQRLVDEGTIASETMRSVMMEELLAHIAQDNRPTVKRKLKELVGQLRSWLREKGFLRLSKMNDSDILYLLKQARDAVDHDNNVVADGTLIAIARPLFSLTKDMPRPTRKIIGSDPVLAAWTALAMHDSSFQLPISNEKTLEGIFEAGGEAYSALKVFRADELGAQLKRNRTRHAWRIVTEGGARAAVYQSGKSVWIDVSDLSSGEDGKRIYNAVANYAFNTGRVFIGDPAGLSDIALTRRLENMISSALKFGTTDHLWPHQRQVDGSEFLGVSGVRWKDGDVAHNLREMINASYEATVKQFPEIRDLRYNPEKDAFEDVNTQEEFTSADFNDLAARGRRGSNGISETNQNSENNRPAGSARGNGSAESRSSGSSDIQRSSESPGVLQDGGGIRTPLTAGRTSLERAVFTRTISRGTREERLQLLANISQLGSERLSKILYSLSPQTNTPESRPSAGISVSGDGDIRFSLNNNPGSLLSQGEKEALDKLGLRPAARRSLIKRIASITTQDIRALADAAGKRTYEGIFDGLIGIKRAEEATSTGIGDGDYAGSGYVGAVLATGTADVMHHVLEFGAVRWESGVLQPVDGTRGLLATLGDLGTDMRDWLAWMGANRAAELMKQGRENNLTKADIAALMSRAKGKLPKFKKAKEEYNKLNKAMLDIAEEAGLIEPGSRKEWESEWYVPFYRRSESDGTPGIMAPRTNRGLSHQASGIKALKGGEIATNNLLDNILTNWLKLADSSLKNSALLKTVDNLKGTDFLLDESLRYQKAVVSRNQIAKQIKGDRKLLRGVAEFLGMPEGADAMKVVGELMKPENKGFEELWASVAPTDPDIIRVRRNGKSEYYRVPDQALLRAVSHLGSQGFNDPVMRGMRFFKRLLTTGVTTSPDFIIRNFLRDIVHAWTINPDGMKLGTDAVKGIVGAFKEDAEYRSLVASGAAFQGGYVHGADPEASAQLVRRAVYRRGLKDIDPDSVLTTPGKIWEVVQKGWQTYRGVGDKVENTNRLATFKRALAAGKPLAQAVYEAKDLMDYSRRGNFAAMMMLTDMIPFLNARVQGFGKLARAAVENKRTVAIRSGMIAAVSVTLAMLNADNEEYEELPEWEKDAYWHFWIGEDHWRVPKPFEIGIVAGTIPERIALNLVGAQENEKLAWTLKHNLLGTFGFSGPYGLPMPQAMQPLIETAANRSFFFDAPVEGMADEGKLPEARYDASTSDTMIKLGEWTGTSPKKLQHMLEGYTGTMGAYALGTVDVVTRWATNHPGKPEKRIEDLPAFRTLYRGDSPRSNRYVGQLYDDLTKAEQVYKTIEAYRGEGKDSLADKLIDKHEDKLAALRMLRKIRSDMSQIRKAILDVQNDQGLSAKEKRERIDELIALRNEIAKDAVQAVKQSMS